MDGKDSPGSGDDEGSISGKPFSGEFTSTGTTAAGDHTQIVDLKGNTRAGGQLLPIIQVASGSDQGRIFSLLQIPRMTIGRAKDSSLILFDPSCSRNHAEIFLGPDGSAWIKDLGSTNGTKVNGNLIKAPTVLNDGERIQLGDATILRFSKIPEDDARVQMDVYHRATRDALTGAYNRHQFQDFLDRELAYVRRGASPQGLGVISFDVDHFKKINDSFGHLAGDEILRDIGKRVATVIRTEDIFARVGGEEFIVLSRADSIEGVRILAERLREVMEKTPGEFEGRGILFTVSVGYTFLPRKAPNPSDQILAIADECLYDAKHGGRNRSIGKELPAPPPGSAV